MFCLCYHQLCDPYRAAVVAGYPPERAYSIGLKLLQTSGVRQELLTLSLSTPQNDLQLALAGLRRLAFCNAGDAVKLAICPPEERTAEFVEKLDLFAVTEIRGNKDGGLDIKLCDRAEALEKLAELSSKQDDFAEDRLIAALDEAAAALEGE